MPSDSSEAGVVSEADPIWARLVAENRELRAYLKAFCAATVDPDENGRDVGVHEANPFVEWEFSLVDEGLKPGRVITGGQVRRAMELVGYDKLKIEPAGRTISDELTEARDLRREVKSLRAVALAVEQQPIATAPFNTEVYVYCGGMRFRAMLVPGASMYEAEDGKLNACDQWQATRDGEHPPCWSEGGCWGSNADENPSIQPTHWSPVEAAPTPTPEA